MSAAAPPVDAAAICAGDVRTHDFGRYAATLFAAPAQRRALLALQAFSGEVTRVRDHISQPLPGEIRLQWWSDTLAGAGHGGVEGHPVAAELLAAMAAYDLAVVDLERIVEAHRFDLYDDAMPTMETLETYLRDTAATMFSLAARICGADAPEALAHHAGLAAGLVRVIALLPVHAARRQLFLPQQLLDLNGVDSADVFAGKATPQLRTVLAYLGREASGHLDLALQALAAAPRQLGPAFLELALVARALRRIGQDDWDPFRPEASSRLAVLWTLWRATRRAPWRG
ncbi:squalene/phytoene synthase family protein [Bradyrhizobium sp. U87765 SZCCT0131]|uniref:phytoene/squalene synthase family protein n=1 Tax=unclassified Bradyrhizobium TaxID=2631580 RepID=UPI001BA759D0|nr:MULTISPECIES: squalene/phytoene synthase family protein [unclassified Bradyrhizobium]MBR1220104.1 squalene/phytoene synthase family protein [Bradyrhizobium sp. U87765 SZCCT0131]MBR1263440.1 squalene/phytoene synthase family protein [Bradyrhizobium sp. U87765 SZCCT0134]MBR1309009.1 squalene/phytoene synthase family protein [Bradyrhizobium sp. U87765 SZCCT0110]MBR1323772.1 squalene/phytoene synthase family protein [Bradyrhizobium sp. U87765 SZCCT0109]MBR1349324.1 squalene/phytoene synthase fa